MKTVIQSLKADGLEAVIKLDQRLGGVSRRGYYEKRFAALTRDPSRFVWLAVSEGGEFAGFVSAHIFEGEFGIEQPVAVLEAIGLAEGKRGRGFGAMLEEALTAELRTRNVTRIFSEVSWTRQDLIAFFGRNHYRLSPVTVLEMNTGRSDAPQFETAQNGSGSPTLARDLVTIRSMKESDLDPIIAIDRKITGKDRTRYYEAKLAEVLNESGVRMSLIAEGKDGITGFLMARVDYGEFGRTARTAVLDTIGVSRAFTRRGVGEALLSQLALNLHSLGVETLQTRVSWNDFPLLAFFDRAGFIPSQRLLFERQL